MTLSIEAKILVVSGLKKVLSEINDRIETCGKLAHADTKLNKEAREYFTKLVLDYQSQIKEIHELIDTIQKS